MTQIKILYMIFFLALRNHILQYLITFKDPYMNFFFVSSTTIIFL